LKRILIIQTAFIGDVVLATVLIEKLKDLFPDSEIDFLLRSGNEELLFEHPKIKEIIVWNKRKNKYFNLFRIAYKVRKKRYDLIVNVHRFSSSGFITWLSGANKKVGFDKNPFSFAYNEKCEHNIGNGKHETVRNLELIQFLGGDSNFKPRLYFSDEDLRMAREIVSDPYVVMAPGSVWFTKQFPQDKWVDLIKKIPETHNICLIGGGNDVKYCENIITKSKRDNMINLSGKLSYLEAVALIKNAKMNFVNDSAPMHFASAVNAPVTAIFCSTIPEFGFGPLSDRSEILQIEEALSCRPCGLHGFKSCPKGHFECATKINVPSELI